MPKDRRTSSFRSRASPYSYGTKNADSCRLRNSWQSIGDEKEWEEARCPICMEHPHNTVLLRCTSHEKGCRPYICNTGISHSNCLKQFLKSPAANPPADTTEEVNPLGPGFLGGDEEQRHRRPRGLPRGRPKPKYLCPLCRGEFTTWAVVEPAREFMNAKIRSCSLETCDFSGTYQELNDHAKLAHRSSRPSEPDPERVREWRRLERERELQDVLVHDQYGGGGSDVLTDALETVSNMMMQVEELRYTVDVVGSRSATTVVEMGFDDLDSSFPLDIVVEQDLTLEMPSMTFGGSWHQWIISGLSVDRDPPPRQRNVSGQSRGGGVGRRNSRTTARMSVRDNSGRRLAGRGGEERDFSWGRRSYRGQ